ncbi:flavin reductase [Serratia oryzae]|uniref:flavin reductase n=1 Tax=Serratia oryzae TaxID=2034155 RepID=UPI001F4F9FE7|nr:flavin reductase [Serratia oryzae]
MYFSDEHRLMLAPVLAEVPENTHVYVCGPARLMAAVSEQASALGYRREQIHQECFGVEVVTQGVVFAVTIANAALRSEQRFIHDSWQVLATLGSAVAHFDCEMNDLHEVGSHKVFYCRVQAVRGGECPRGLVYFNRRYYDLAEE